VLTGDDCPERTSSVVISEYTIVPIVPMAGTSLEPGLCSSAFFMPPPVPHCCSGADNVPQFIDVRFDALLADPFSLGRVAVLLGWRHVPRPESDFPMRLVVSDPTEPRLERDPKILVSALVGERSIRALHTVELIDELITHAA
jgi:hypothetical protein